MISKVPRARQTREDRALVQERRKRGPRLLRSLYRGVDGIATARRAAVTAAAAGPENGTSPRPPSDKSLTYGEVTFSSFLQILDFVMRLRPTADGVFVDLGCGTGKAVLTAALSEARFSLCWGIEIVPDLLELALCVKKAFEDLPTSRPSAGAANATLTSAATATVKRVKSVEVPAEEAIIDAIISLFNSSSSKSEASGTASASSSLPADWLASKVCDHVGHKAFKAFVKKHKNFSNFVKVYCADVLVIEGKAISLVRSAPTNGGGGSGEGEGVVADISYADDPKTHDDANNIDITTSEVAHDDENIDADAYDGSDGACRLEDVAEMAADRSVFTHVPDIRFDVGDIYLIPWWESASVVYVASLLFSNDMMERLTDLALRLQPGSVVVSLKAFPRTRPDSASWCDTEGESANKGRPYLRLVSDSFYRMSWQMAQVLIYVVEIECLNAR